MGSTPKKSDYYVTVEVEAEWAKTTVSRLFAVITASPENPDVPPSFAVLNGWVVDDSHPHGLLLKMVLAEDFGKMVKGEQLTALRTGHCFIPWRYVLYIAYLEAQKSPLEAVAQNRRYGFQP